MVSRPKLADPGALIRGGKLRTDEYRVCLDPDLVNEYERLLAARDAAKAEAADSLAGGRTVELDAQVAEILEQMQTATITLVFKALPRPEFRAMCDRHPPRKDAEGKVTHAEDGIGVNFDSFFDEIVRSTLVAPVLEAEDRDRLFDELLTDRQWQDLTDVVWLLNRAKVSVPFLPAVSPSRRSSSPR